MTGMLEFTILGSGSSAGVPRADGNWGECDPANPRNRRSRCSLLVRRKGGPPEEQTTVLVDTSPDLRLQAVAAGVGRIDAVVLTHDHADQTHGIDEVRAFFIKHRKRVDCFMDLATEATMMRRFGYIFVPEGGYPNICIAQGLPPHAEAWSIDGPSGAVPIVTFDQDHGGPRSVGYRFGDVAYSSDVVGLDEAAFAALQDLDVWIVDALRYTPHPTHSHVAQTLEWISRVKPKRAILTNLHFELDYATLSAQLPDGVEAAYDGLRFDHPLRAEFP